MGQSKKANPSKRSRTSKFPRLIGVIHLPPLPGSYNCLSIGAESSSTLQNVGYRAVQEALALQKAGFDSVIIENFGDAPFQKCSVNPETIASMAIIAMAVKESTRLKVGVNVLRNDARAALGIASVTACDFIRVNVLSGVYATDQGWIEGHASALMEARAQLGKEIQVFADVHVKHAVSYSSGDLSVAIEELVTRAKADAVIITGESTGRSANQGDVELASEVCQKLETPLYIGSGVTRENIRESLRAATGIIVGSALRKGGGAGEPLDNRRMKELIQATKQKKSGKIRKKKTTKSKKAK